MDFIIGSQNVTVDRSQHYGTVTQIFPPDLAVIPKHPDLQLVDISDLSEEADQTILLDHDSTPKQLEVVNPLYKYSPVVDIKLKNIGTGTAFIKRLTVFVEEAKVDITPIIKIEAEVIDNSLEINLYNFGWGVAKNVNLKLISGNICNYLLPSVAESNWRGDLRDKIEFSLPSRSIAFEKLPEVHDVATAAKLDIKTGIKCDSEIYGEIEYEDEMGTRFEGNVIYELQDGSALLLTNKGFMDIIDLGKVMGGAVFGPSATYSISLKAVKSYQRTYTISHSVEADQVERLQVKISSNKSAFYKLKFLIEYDEKGSLYTPLINVWVNNPKKIKKQETTGGLAWV